MKYAAVLAVATIAVIPTSGVFGLGQCLTPVTNCLNTGHHTFTPSDYPYTEDITDQGSPVADPLVLTGPATAFTLVMGGCVDVNGFNLNSTQTFNALLRAMIQVQSTTAATGARFEIQLLVDGVQWGWYLRRLRGKYPQHDVFTATAPSLPAGSHKFTVMGRLLDSGTITLTNTYTSAFGAPATNPSVRSVNAAQVSVNSPFFQPVTNSATFTNAAPVDFVVQGYFQVDSGTATSTLSLAPFLDGVRQFPTSEVAVPPNFSDGINFLSILSNVPAGTHTLQWKVLSNGSTTVFSNRAIDGMAFPSSTYQVLAANTMPLTVQSLSTPSGPQPAFLVPPQATPGLNDGCGYWTNILTATMGADPTGYNTIYEGFVNFTGASTGTSSYGQLWWETYFLPTGTATDGGNRGIEIFPYGGGVYLVGDAMNFSENNPETFNLWARKVNAFCGGSAGGYGTFDVSDRYFFIRHTPISPVATTCWYK